jgi:hypothetical protein
VRTRSGGRGLAVVGVVTIAALVASCGSATTGTSTYLASGQVPKADLPAPGSSAAKALSSTESTIPLTQQNPTTALFTSLGVFQGCLAGLGVTFIGAPNPKDPSSPANNPTYLKNLETCATKSNILQALKAAQTAQNNLTPSQVKTENEQYLKWRTCMIARGWGIPQPTPNAKGLLFSFSASSSAESFKPPPGQSLLSSPDLQACAAKAQQEVK